MKTTTAKMTLSRKAFLPWISALTLSGCVSMESLPITGDQDKTTVNIYRSNELQGSAVDVYIGWDDKYFVALSPNQRTQIDIPSGLTHFKVRAHADLSNELTVELPTQQTICLQAEVNPQNIVGLNWFVSGYQLRQINCPSEQQNKLYEYREFTKLNSED